MPWCPNSGEEYDEPKLLVSVSSSREAEMIEAMLKSNNIPVYIKDKGLGSYIRVYLGASFLGAEIYVPKKLYDRAKELITFEPEETVDNEEETKMMIEEEKYNNKKRKTALLSIILYTGAIGIITYLIVKLVEIFKK